MTNFLTRLVGRTLGTIPVVQPRIVSMFDPDRGSRGAEEQGGFFQSFIYNSHLAPQEVEPPRSRSQVEPGNENTEAPPQGTRCEDRGEFAEAATGISFQPNSTSFDSSEMQTKSTNSDLVDGLSGENVESNPMISNRLSVPSLRSKTEIVAASFDNNKATLFSSPNQEDTRLHRNADLLTMGETIAAIPQSPELKQKPPNPSSRKDEQIEKLPIPNYPFPITNYQVPITPTIRVSIGRIEVRAIVTPPAPPAPQKSAPTPKLSLSEYLRKTGGGG